ncbi:MAG: M3 family oligoendopeptidase [Elusimicrobiota bacterium]|jgi:oligoendopeptidase F
MTRTLTTLLTLILSLPALAAPYKPDANAPRAAVPVEYTWDLSTLYKDDASWEKAMSDAAAKIRALAMHKGQLSQPASARDTLNDYFATRQLVDRAAAYAHLQAAVDTESPQVQEKDQRALKLGSDFRSSSAFIRLELLRLDDKAAAALLADPLLAPYRDYVSDLRRRRTHLLGDEGEKVLSLAEDNLWSETDLNEIPSDVERVFKAATHDIEFPLIKDEEGKEVRLTLSNYAKYRASKDRRVRRETVEALFGTLRKNKDILAATLGGEAKRDVFLARARGYARSADAYLDREGVPTAMVETLVEAVHRNLKPLHRYVALRKKILGVDEFRFYDLYPPLVPAAEKEVPYDEGLKDVFAALKPLGPDYAAELKTLLADRMSDVYPCKGKDSGAFAHSLWGLPPRVMLNHFDQVDDVSTAAHEYGHAMHSALNMAANAAPDFGYSSLIAETASTFNEMLLARHLLAKYKGDDTMRLYLLGNLLDTLRGTIYRQTLFTEFELKLHGFVEQGVPVTPELLNRTYADLVKLYYGPDFVLGPDDGIEWAYIPHFYWKHYVFSYAGGLSSSIALSEKVYKGEKGARENYLGMLRNPRELPPVESMRGAGVDLLKPDYVDAAGRLMDETVAEMEKLAERTILKKK